MKQPFRHTLTGQTLLRLGLGGAAVLLLATALGTGLLYRQLEEQASARLASQTTERARVAERVLSHNVETLEALRQAFLALWPRCGDARTAQRFHSIMALYPDGEWRNRREIADGRLHPTGWISKTSALSDDLRCRFVLFFDVSQKYGPGAAVRRDNLFFISVPEQGNMGYDPYLYPNWIFDIGDRFNQLDHVWGRLAYQPVPPGAAPRWTPPYVDEVAPANGPVFSVLLPVHVGQRQLATVGSTVLMRDFLARAFPEAPADSRFLLFHPAGELMADTGAAARVLPDVRLQGLDGGLGQALQRSGRAAGAAPQTGYSAGADTYYAVARIDGPGWLVAATLPGGVVRARALEAGALALAAGFGALLTLMLVFAGVLRRQVAAPLGELTRAAERLAGGDVAVRLPSGRQDELGRLASAFNHMTAKVAERDAALRQDKGRIEAALTSLRLNEERWRAMTDNASDCVAVLDAAGTLRDVSTPVERMLGYRVEQLLGRPLDGLLHADDVAALRQQLQRPGQGATQLRVRHASGDWRVLEALGSDLRQHPAVRGVVLNIRDISAAVQAEQQLRQAQKLEAIGTLAGGIAHDFNNILAAILGYGEMVQRAAPPDTPLRRHIDAAMSAALRAKSLVQRILAFSRGGMGERVAVHVQATVAEALQAIAASLPAGVRLEQRLEAGAAAVLGDPTQVHQVVMNLCANAVQAIKSSGTLSVTLERVDPAEAVPRQLPAGPCLRLCVRDTGEGIAAAQLPRIFDPFFSTKPVGVGTGLGLSLVHGIVGELGGAIEVASVPGQGSLFSVYLPLHGTAAAPAEADAALPDGAGQTVLFVDDEETLVRLGEEMLAGLGYEPVGFASGAAALRSLRATPQRFHAVLTDEAMPGLTGAELARAILQLRPDLPIVLMTGFVTPELAARARAIGIAEVLAKPLVAQDIARVLASLLRPA